MTDRSLERVRQLLPLHYELQPFRTPELARRARTREERARADELEQLLGRVREERGSRRSVPTSEVDAALGLADQVLADQISIHVPELEVRGWKCDEKANLATRRGHLSTTIAGALGRELGDDIAMHMCEPSLTAESSTAALVDAARRALSEAEPVFEPVET